MDYCGNSRKKILQFNYNGEERIVEPQTYGLSGTGKELLRAFQRAGGSKSGQRKMAKLFEVQKISNLKVTKEKFAKALPSHNPHDSGMVKIFASLPLPTQKRTLKLKSRRNSPAF